MAALYATFRQLVDAERFDESDDVVERLRLELNQRYDDFASLYGPLQAKTNQAVLKGMPNSLFC
ncbi:MAG: hypothetical protein HC853_01215 [Anaerolineae bacterium]|nr:hypothetical protein [Anaerolineae bacterium]